MTLKNGPLDLHPKVHSTYQLSAVTTANGFPIWTSSTHAIWYSNTSNMWVIGSFTALGTNDVIFRGNKNTHAHFLMPCEANCWMYFNNRFKDWQKPKGYGLFYHDNDINIQCTSKV